MSSSSIPYSTLSQPKSGWQLFKSLVTGAITPGLAWQKSRLST